MSLIIIPKSKNFHASSFHYNSAVNFINDPLRVKFVFGKVKSNHDQRQSLLNTIQFGLNTWISLQEWLQITLSFHTGIQWSQCPATEAHISKFTTITHAPTGPPHFIRPKRRVQNDKMLPVYSLDCLCRQYFRNYPENIFHDWINYTVLGVTSAWISWKTLLVTFHLGLMIHYTVVAYKVSNGSPCVPLI